MNGNDQGIQLQDLSGIVRRRGVVAGAVAGVVMLASVVVAAVLPNEYEAWTTLLVEPQTVSPVLVEAALEGSELNQRLHLMTMTILSRGRLSKAIDDLGLYKDEGREMTREEVIDLMRDHIRVEPVRPEMGDARAAAAKEQEINTFRLYYRSHSARIAAAVADKLANDFIDQHIRERVEMSGDTSDFIEAELVRLSTQIAEVEQRIAAVKNENTGRLPEDLEANQRLLERAMTELRIIQRDLSIAESDEAFYRNQALTGGGSVSDARPDTPTERKQRLEIALGEAQARGLTEKHPDIIAIRDELAALTASIATAVPDEVPQTPEQQLAANESKRAQLRAQSARAEAQALQSEIATIEERIGATPRVAEQLVGLQRQHDHLYESFQKFSGKRLEAGVAANMERRQKGEQVRILETAFPPPMPTSPNRPVILALGILFGLALGAGAALALELLDTSVHAPRQLQTAFRLPVLAAIPRVVLESDRIRQRRRYVVGALAAGAFAMVVLVGAGAGYWIVNGSAGGGDAPAEGAAPAAAQPARQG